MKKEAVVIIVSGNSNRFGKATEAISRQTTSFTEIVVAPWGSDRGEIERIAKNQKIDTRIVSCGEDASLEGSRNNALRSIASVPPDWVAFVDDDTIIDSNWLYEMVTAVNGFGNNWTFATVVTHADRPEVIQSAGHIIFESRPLDCAYNHPISAICASDQPLCPCGNSAFIPWEAIERISRLDENVWDPRFKQWQTCFDFGLKLQLVDFGCRLVRSAFATHEGICGRKKVLNQDDVMNQLRSRILLYDKFYPPEEKAEAMDCLKNRVYGRWKEEGYPSAPFLRGEKIIETFKMALDQEKKLRQGMSNIWLEKMEELDESYRRGLLFNGTVPGMPHGTR